MARETETARMSDPLAVAENHVGIEAELPPCLEERRDLAEGEEPRHVRKRAGTLEYARVDDFEAGIRKDREGGPHRSF